MSGNPTIDDVAAHARVARTTVSRVLNGGPNVRDEVRARVMNSVEALGYTVNVQARLLAGGTTRTIALILEAEFDSEPNSFYSSAIEVGALRASVAGGCHLLPHYVMWANGDVTAQIEGIIINQRCGGIVLTPPFSDDVALVRRIEEIGCAVACISPGQHMRAEASGVGIDEALACYDGACHLMALGHRRFGFLKGLAGHQAAELRYQGFMRALQEQGLAENSVVALRGNFTFKSGIDLLPQIVGSELQPTALLCANDDMAAGALFAAHQRGIDVPGQLSILGFDDTPVSAIVWPPLSTIHQPIKEMGARAVELVIAVMAQRGTPLARSFQTMPHELVVRQSTGPKADPVAGRKPKDRIASSRYSRM